MTDNRTAELPRMQLHRLLEKHDVDYWCVQQTTFWNSESGSEFLAYQYQVDGVYKLAFKGVNVTPEQAIAATLGNGTCKVESKLFIERLYGADCYYDYTMECGGSFSWSEVEPPKRCPNCGKAVEQ